MKLWVLAVGQKVPVWADQAWQDYAKRFPPELRLELKAIKTEPRAGKSVAQLTAAEARRIQDALPKNAHPVLLDERGAATSTLALADKLRQWQSVGDDVAFLIGGPDGLDPTLKQSVKDHIRISDLTLPHAMVRVILAEQLYRAWSLTVNHPYHRE